jgi:hypothetical protein
VVFRCKDAKHVTQGRRNDSVGGGLIMTHLHTAVDTVCGVHKNDLVGREMNAAQLRADSGATVMQGCATRGAR